MIPQNRERIYISSNRGLDKVERGKGIHGNSIDININKKRLKKFLTEREEREREIIIDVYLNLNPLRNNS